MPSRSSRCASVSRRLRESPILSINFIKGVCLKLPCRAFVLLSVWLFAFLPGSIGSDDVRAWDIPRFSAEGTTLYKAASSVNPKAGTEVVVLDEEENYVFDADGKAIRTHYLVYKVLTQKGSEGSKGC
jgi:hypothetical protein